MSHRAPYPFPAATDPWLPAPQPKPIPAPIPPWPGEPPPDTLRRSLVPPLPTDYTAGHRYAHPHPRAGCPLCPQDGSCRWCGLPLSECPDEYGHDRLHRGSESTWRGAA